MLSGIISGILSDIYAELFCDIYFFNIDMCFMCFDLLDNHILSRNLSLTLHIHIFWYFIWHILSLLFYLILFYMTSWMHAIWFFLVPFCRKYHSVWHSIWHLFWQSVWHTTTCIFWHSTWHPFWHFIRHLFWHPILHFIRHIHEFPTATRNINSHEVAPIVISGPLAPTEAKRWNCEGGRWGKEERKKEVALCLKSSTVTCKWGKTRSLGNHLVPHPRVRLFPPMCTSRPSWPEQLHLHLVLQGIRHRSLHCPVPAWQRNAREKGNEKTKANIRKERMIQGATISDKGLHRNNW